MHEAAALLEEIRRARIEPFAWVINASLRHSGSVDPLLQRGHPHDLAALAGGRAGWSGCPCVLGLGQASILRPAGTVRFLGGIPVGPSR